MKITNVTITLQDLSGSWFSSTSLRRNSTAKINVKRESVYNNSNDDQIRLQKKIVGMKIIIGLINELY